MLFSFSVVSFWFFFFLARCWVFVENVCGKGVSSCHHQMTGVPVCGEIVGLMKFVFRERRLVCWERGSGQVKVRLNSPGWGGQGWAGELLTNTWCLLSWEWLAFLAPPPPHQGGHRVCWQVSSLDSLAALFSVHCFLPFPSFSLPFNTPSLELVSSLQDCPPPNPISHLAAKSLTWRSAALKCLHGAPLPPSKSTLISSVWHVLIPPVCFSFSVLDLQVQLVQSFV